MAFLISISSIQIGISARPEHDFERIAPILVLAPTPTLRFLCSVLCRLIQRLFDFRYTVPDRIGPYRNESTPLVPDTLNVANPVPYRISFPVPYRVSEHLVWELSMRFNLYLEMWVLQHRIICHPIAQRQVPPQVVEQFYGHITCFVGKLSLAFHFAPSMAYNIRLVAYVNNVIKLSSLSIFSVEWHDLQISLSISYPPFSRGCRDTLLDLLFLPSSETPCSICNFFHHRMSLRKINVLKGKDKQRRNEIGMRIVMSRNKNKKNKTINFLKLPMVYVLPYGLLKRKQTMKTFGGMVFGDETIPRKKCGHVTLCGYLNK
ncbi:hypothetical protein LXL04_007955 [Taraxacum kok-saghyz]